MMRHGTGRRRLRVGGSIETRIEELIGPVMSWIQEAMIAPFVVACALVVAGGAAKMMLPASALVALRESGISSTPTVVRLVGLIETCCGMFALVLAQPIVHEAIAGLYAVFAAFLARSLILGLSVTSCGCIGGSGARQAPSWGHVAMNVLALAVALAFSLMGPLAPVSELLRQGLAGVPAWIGIGGSCAGAFLLLYQGLPTNLSNRRLIKRREIIDV
jgi:hypothetical protein